MRWALAAFLVACRSEAIQQAPTPQPSAPPTTSIVFGTPDDASVPDCTVHGVSDAFTPAHATQVATVRVEGDYTRALAKVTIDRPHASGWSGTFNGTRDLFFDMLRSHVCTKASAYAAKPGDNKDPVKAPVVLTIYELEPNEKADVDALCHATLHEGDAGNADERDRAAMTWATDNLTTPKWDAWRRGFARSRAELFTQKADAGALFRERATELDAAARALGLKCPTAAEWAKR